LTAVDAPLVGQTSRERVLRELVVCSLEPWDEIWRRNQFFVDALLRREPALRILFVEPAADPLFDLTRRRFPRPPRMRSPGADGRLVLLRPLKVLPRRLADDRALHASVARAAGRLGFKRPVLWVNDVTYAPLITKLGWPAVYDVTDDWLLANASGSALERLRRLDALAIEQAVAVVVCSPALASSRGARRPVKLIPNAVDLDHFRRERPRPDDLPRPCAVYVGTLHDERLDIALVLELARAEPALSVVLVGPDALGSPARAALRAAPNVVLLGRRPYADVPAYLQHADVLIVPHVVSPFTESLDPIKAHETLAVTTPAVATAVAGFREISGLVDVVERDRFVHAVRSAIERPKVRICDAPPASWTERAAEFADVLDAAAECSGGA
jgi:teichuronic acid biosynthesis glycosyltransferase TuaH